MADFPLQQGVFYLTAYFCISDFITVWIRAAFVVFVLIQADADSFYTACNGRQFNSIEDAVCQLVYVERAEVIKSEEVNALIRSVCYNKSSKQKNTTYCSDENSHLKKQPETIFGFSWYCSWNSWERSQPSAEIKKINNSCSPAWKYRLMWG